MFYRSLTRHNRSDVKANFYDSALGEILLSGKRESSRTDISRIFEEYVSVFFPFSYILS